MKSTVRVDGLRELDHALGELPKATGKAVLKRVLKKAGEPIAEAARQMVPVDSGKLRDSITVSPKIKNTVGAAEFRDVMSNGGSREEAISALRGARRAAAGEGSFAEMFVGPGRLPYAHLVEFGSVHNSPQPFMRPAFEKEKGHALQIIKDTLGDEIMKTAKRLAARALKKAGR